MSFGSYDNCPAGQFFFAFDFLVLTYIKYTGPSLDKLF